MAKHKAVKQVDRSVVWRYVAWGLICLLVLSIQTSGHAIDSIVVTPSPTPTLPSASATPTPKPSKSYAPVPYLAQKKGKKNGYWKNTSRQRISSRKWTNFSNGSKAGAFKLNGKRTLFFAQLHVYCSVKPRYIKIRLARHLKNGTLDTTGTNTWTVGKTSTSKWQGSLWWESRTRSPITAQFKVVGGKCYSPQRQFKWWQP